MSTKRGRLSKRSEAFIKNNAHKLPAKEIAEHVERTVEMVEDYISKFVPPPEPDPEAQEKWEIRTELRMSQAWVILQKEFSREELLYFEESYIKLMSQFKGDVLPTEETQVLQCIKFEILMSRNLTERKKAREDIRRMEYMQGEFLKEKGGETAKLLDKDRETLLTFESQIQTSKVNEQSRTNEFVKLQEKHSKLLENLKATRDQRVEQIENSKVSFLSLIKTLQERDIQEQEGRKMELMRLAGEKEYDRLGHVIQYEDGTFDNPILSADTVEFGPLESEEEDVDDGATDSEDDSTRESEDVGPGMD